MQICYPLHRNPTAALLPEPISKVRKCADPPDPTKGTDRKRQRGNDGGKAPVSKKQRRQPNKRVSYDTSRHAAQKNARCARTLYYVLSSILCANYCALTSCRVDTNSPCAFQSRPPVRENFVDSTDPSLSFATPRGGLGAAAFRD